MLTASAPVKRLATQSMVSVTPLWPFSIGLHFSGFFD